MSKPVGKVSVLNRGKKGTKQNAQKGSAAFNIASECAAKHSITSASKENLTTEQPVMYDGNQIETLVGEERVKQSYASVGHSNTDYDILKSSNGEVDFGGGNCGEFCNSLPRIVDLCLEDKKRILQLINELANCKEEKEMMTKEISCLKESVKQQQDEMKLSSERFAAQKEALALEVENLVTSRDNLSSDLENLQNCIEIQKNEIEKQTLCIASLKSEKRHLQKQLLDQENKIKAATTNVEFLMERLSFYEPQVKKREFGQPSTPKNIDNKMNAVPGSCRVEKSQLVKSNDIKVNENNCFVKSDDIQKTEERDQLLISELFFRSKDVPEILEPIFFKSPCHAQPIQMWDSLL